MTAIKGWLHTLHPNEIMKGVTKREMCDVYTLRMANKLAPGRVYYDRILGAAKHGRCPLCGQRTVSTIDHHLPKTYFPAFAVVPANLVPACQDCNKAKSDWVPKMASQQTFHPYFDNFEDERWLYATLIEVIPVAVRFAVTTPKTWSHIRRRRVQLHFTTFALASLYASHAAQELVDIQHSLRNLFNVAGADAVRKTLREDHASRHAARINSWQTALYEALSESDWYCEGGFVE